jgi:hypothetical protein
MISPQKLDQALEAIHTILTLARREAQASNHDLLAKVLDQLEILPAYIADARIDRTDDFRQVLVGIAAEFSDAGRALNSFDDACTHHWY